MARQGARAGSGSSPWEKSMILRHVFAVSALVLMGFAAAPHGASAQTYPSRTVHVVVPYAAGGTGDIVARVIADKLAPVLGQSVVVENRPGASGALGTKSVIAAAPDGHTLLMGQTGEIAINQHWSKNLGYDTEKELAPVALATCLPIALVLPVTARYVPVSD